MRLMIDPTRTADCLSALRLDELAAGELDAGAAAAARAHLAGCARCTARRDALAADRERFRALPPAFPGRAAPRRRWAWWSAGAAALLAVAGLLLVLRAAPREPDAGTQRKGGGRLGVYIKRDGAVRAGASGDVVRPGDALRFTYTLDEPAHLIVAGIDGAGAVAVYFPDGPLAAPVAAASDAPLPGSIELDGVRGAERFHAVFCAAPIPVDTVVRALRAGEPAIAGCAIDRLVLEKP